MPDTLTGHLLLRDATDRLAGAGIPDALPEARLLLASALRVPLSRLDLHLADPTAPDAAERIGRLVHERATRRPLAYVVGHTEFMGLRFRCDPRALVPRPETEVLVAEVHRRLAQVDEPGLLLDVGTGTGAIGLSLAALVPRLRVVLTDVSPGALALAEGNAASLGVTGRARLLQGRDLDPVAEAGVASEVRCLVSNPPYIPPRDVPGLPPEVALHEPSIAWEGDGEEGTGFYERIVPQCPARLPGLRLVAFEVGLGQAERVGLLCRDAWPDWTVSVTKDLNGIDRVAIAEPVSG